MSSQSASDPSNPQNPDPKTLDSQTPEISNQSDTHPEKDPIQNAQNSEGKGEEVNEEEEEEEEEEGECGFCLFMKGGGCKDAFIAWENCVEEAEKNKEDIVEKCFQITGNLKMCMEAHSEYYEPILRAEKAAEEEVRQEMERESEKKSDDQIEEKSAEIEVQKDS